LDGVRTPISGSYDICDSRQVRFRLGTYDTTRPLMIDPQLIYSSHIGGWGDEQGMGLALDNNGNMYLSGITSSTNLPLITDPRRSSRYMAGGHMTLLS
jgi:large repetitive protein